MANVVYDPGMKDSFTDLANIIQIAGVAEQQRQKRTAAERIVMAIASGDDGAVNTAIQEAVQMQEPGGIRGLLSRLGVPGYSPSIAAVDEAMPLYQNQRQMQYNDRRLSNQERQTQLNEKRLDDQLTRTPSTVRLNNARAAYSERFNSPSLSPDQIQAQYGDPDQSFMGTVRNSLSAVRSMPGNPPSQVSGQAVRMKAPDGTVWELDASEEQEAAQNGYVRIQ